MHAIALAGFMLLAAVMRGVGGEAGAPAPVPVSLDFFYEVGCDSCAEIRRAVLPELRRRYAGLVDLHEREVGVTSNYLLLVRYQEQAGIQENEPVSMGVDGQVLLAGLPRIRKDLFPALDSALERRLVAPVPESGTGGEAGRSDEQVRHRVAGFTVAGVVGAAVVDSINPCAISTLVFFMSLLSVARIGIRRMWLAGLSFLLACFVTYLAIGFGLLKVLEVLSAWQGLRRGLEGLLLAVMAVLAGLSFRDAWRFSRTERPDEVTLKLPASLQLRLHQIMRTGLRRRHLALSGLGTGVVVTLMESVCTGQVYVPALVMMLKSGQSVMRAGFYLVLYNLIFILPLAVVLTLTCWGLGTPALVDWSRRNVAFSKMLMGLFFLGMMALLVALPS